MDQITPIVITSKVADDYLHKIKVEHADILTGMVNQELKMNQYKQEQDVMQKEEDSMRADRDQTSTENQIKMKELEIKQQALAL